MNNKIKNWYGIWSLIMIVLFLLAFLLSLINPNLYFFLIAIIFSFLLSYMGTRKARELNWYPIWALISILLFFCTFLYNFGWQLYATGRFNFPPNLIVFFNLLLVFFSILTIFLSIKGVKKAKGLNGGGKILSIICLILGILLFSIMLFEFPSLINYFKSI